MKRRIISCVLVLAVNAVQAAWGLDVVWIDREDGTSFRHPDSLRPLDPYSRRLVDGTGFRRLAASAGDGGTPTWGEHEVLHFSREVEAGDGRDLPAIVGGMLAMPVEPAEDAGSATTHLRCTAGRIVALRHDGRISCVGIGSGIAEAAAARIMATFECLAQPGVARMPRATAREAACRSGMLILADGTLRRCVQVPRATSLEGAIEYESRYFQIRGTLPTEEMAPLALHLDSLHAALRAWLPLPAEPVEKQQVVVVKTAAEFVALTGGAIPTDKDGHPGQEGLYLPGARVALTFSDRNGYSIGTLRMRASHEVVHQYLHGHARAFPPRFFDEGCAVLFENGSRQGDAFILPMQEVRLRLLQMSYRQLQSTLAPFADYLAQRVPLTTNHYGECYAMLRVLAVTQGGTSSVPGLTAAWRVLLESPGADGGSARFSEALLGRFGGTGGGDVALAAWQASVQRLVGQASWKESLRIALP